MDLVGYATTERMFSFRVSGLFTESQLLQREPRGVFVAFVVGKGRMENSSRYFSLAKVGAGLAHTYL